MAIYRNYTASELLYLYLSPRFLRTIQVNYGELNENIVIYDVSEKTIGSNYYESGFIYEYEDIFKESIVQIRVSRKDLTDMYDDVNTLNVYFDGAQHDWYLPLDPFPHRFESIVNNVEYKGVYRNAGYDYFVSMLTISVYHDWYRLQVL